MTMRYKTIKPYNWFFMKLGAIFCMMSFAGMFVSMWWLARNNPEKYWISRMNTYGEWGIELVMFTILIGYSLLILGIDLKQHWDEKVRE
jgi:hypothetical protein